MTTLNTSSLDGTYRAVCLTSIAKNIPSGIADLQLLDLPRRPLRNNEVRIRVAASALNYFDLLITTGQYQSKPKLPFVMGSECAGVVLELHPTVSRTLTVGQRVMIGMTFGGAMASEMVVNAEMVIPAPTNMSFAQCAAFPVGFLTAYHALVHRGRLSRSETVIISGAAGGMGIAAIHIAKHIGANIIALASSQAKCATARRSGAAYTIDTSKHATADAIKAEVVAFTKKRMCDVAYDVVGSPIFESLMKCMASGGRILVVGFAGGKIPRLQANLLLVKGISVIGVRAGAEMIEHPTLAKEMFNAMVEWTAEDGGTSFAPNIDITFPVEKYQDAFRHIADRKVIGKTAVIWSDEQQQQQPRNNDHTNITSTSTSTSMIKTKPAKL